MAAPRRRRRMAQGVAAGEEETRRPPPRIGLEDRQNLTQDIAAPPAAPGGARWRSTRPCNAGADADSALCSAICAPTLCAHPLRMHSVKRSEGGAAAAKPRPHRAPAPGAPPPPGASPADPSRRDGAGGPRPPKAPRPHAPAPPGPPPPVGAPGGMRGKIIGPPPPRVHRARRGRVVQWDRRLFCLMATRWRICINLAGFPARGFGTCVRGSQQGWQLATARRQIAVSPAQRHREDGRRARAAWDGAAPPVG